MGHQCLMRGKLRGTRSKPVPIVRSYIAQTPIQSLAAAVVPKDDGVQATWPSRNPCRVDSVTLHLPRPPALQISPIVDFRRLVACHAPDMGISLAGISDCYWSTLWQPCLTRPACTRSAGVGAGQRRDADRILALAQPQDRTDPSSRPRGGRPQRTMPLHGFPAASGRWPHPTAQSNMLRSIS